MIRDIVSTLIIIGFFSLAVALPQTQFSHWEVPISPFVFVTVLSGYFVLLIFLESFSLKKIIRNRAILLGAIIVNWGIPWKYLASIFEDIYLRPYPLAAYAITLIVLAAASLACAYLFVWRNDVKQ